jgi:hypothetical protein
MRTCSIYGYDTGGEELKGKVFLTDGNWISFEISSDEELALSTVANNTVRMCYTEGLAKKEDDLFRCFENLPKMYQLSYF